MQLRYRLIISSKNIHKEIELAPELNELKIGTGVDCAVRLRKDMFFGQIELALVQDREGWRIACSDSVYLTHGDVRKLVAKQLKHGDELSVRYQESGNEVFTLFFTLDFDYERKEYNRAIDISNKNTIIIGSALNSDILIIDEYLASEYISLVNENEKWFLIDNNTRYGAYINGVKVQKKKEIKDYDFFAIVGYSFYFKNKTLFTSSNQNIKVNGLRYEDSTEQKSHLTYPKFKRNTRVQYEIPEIDLEIQQPVQKPQKPKKNIVMSLIPAVIMLAMTIFLRGVMGGGSSFVIYSAVSMSVGVVMSVVSFVQDSRNYKKEFAERIKNYNKYIEEKRVKIEEARSNELRVRNLIYESLDNSIQEAMDFGRRLFEKSPEDADFLQIYLGKGTVESANEVKYAKQEFIDTQDPLAEIPRQVAEEYRFIENAPIISDFNASNGIGVVGKKAELNRMIKNLSLDVALRHFYGEVKLVYIVSPADIGQMSWVRWLHNVENDQLKVKNIVCDDESKNLILENLYSVLSSRENERRENEQTAFDQYYIVLVTDSSVMDRHPITKYIRNCNDLGFTFVFFEEYEEFLPQGCTEIIRIDSHQSGKALKTRNGDVIADFVYPDISDKTAGDVALKLGAVTVDEVTLEGQLTKNITMFELLDIISVEDLNLAQRWEASLVYKSLSAPLGVKSKNQIVYLDISDKAGAHGPHGLVAGTTGSGKSEILQTYILSMATLFHPYEVGFVIIDFKGGGMANQFKELPHLIGTITNIDGREISRSLLSIKAELVKRQEMFSACGVNHINDYIKLYKSGKVEKPLPHLIMIVDEFAELKAEHPDFMKEIISAARIGRTLGIHLILATQKPAGVVDNQIWSNSRFKLCLKVQTKEDSNEVIKTPLAAEIVEPGRAYFQVGNNEIFELFQSAYSGGNVPTGSDSSENIFEVFESNIWGGKTLVYTNRKVQTETESKNQLQAIVEFVNDYCLKKGVKKLPGICLPSLADVMKTDALVYDAADELGLCIPIGVFDDPQQQRQGEATIEPSKENIYIVGSAQSGKTVMLQTITYGLIKKYDPSQVNIYLIDCGSMVLKIFENASHVGGVVLSSEEEKCKNLFKLLNTIVAERKSVLSGKGVGNFAAYLDAGFKDLPMIVVIIDNMAAFKEYFPDQADELNSLTREAQGVGISFIITAAASNALNYRTQSNFGKKFVLNCNDPNEYSSVFGHCKDTPKENPGRGLMMLDKRILEYQVAIFGKGDKEAERSQELKRFIEDRNTGCMSSARAIPMVPEKLVLHHAITADSRVFRNKGLVPIGMDFETVDYSVLDMNTCGFLALTGDAECRERFALKLLSTLKETIIFHNAEAIVIDDKYKTLKECAAYGFVKKYTNDVSEALSLIGEFSDEVLNRHDELDEPDDAPYLLLVLNNTEVLKKICNEKADSKAFADLIKGASEFGAFILISTVDNQPVGFNSSDILKAVKDERKGILFAPLSESKLFEITGRNRTDASYGKSVGYRFDGGNYSKIKIFE